jgi:AMMECR1 domain-containing protein
LHPKTNFSPNSSIFEGLINGEVHLVALVVSSRPGLTLPTHSAESPWTQLEMLEHNDSEAVLLKLCGENRRTFERAMELCSTFKFPKYIFWYSLLVIEAESMDAY